MAKILVVKLAKVVMMANIACWLNVVNSEVLYDWNSRIIHVTNY